MKNSCIVAASLLTLALFSIPAQSMASATAVEMGIIAPQGQAKYTKQKASYVFVIEISSVTLSPKGGDRYTLIFNAKNMTLINAISRPPFADVEKLTPKQFSKIAHSGGKESFDSDPPNFFLEINQRLKGAFALIGYEKKGDSNIIYELRALPYYANGYFEGKKPSLNPRIPTKPITGHASLFLDDKGLFM